MTCYGHTPLKWQADLSTTDQHYNILYRSYQQLFSLHFLQNLTMTTHFAQRISQEQTAATRVMILFQCVCV